MKVRKASRDDIEQVRELVEELGYDGTEMGLSSQLDTYIDSDSALLLVAENPRGTLAGMIAGHLIPLIHQAGNVGRITSFVVRTNNRSSGVGTALLEALESWFSERECLRFEVTSGDHRAQAHEFYNSKGYVSDERRYLKRRDT
jgi:N-acetylglutamate synthase-like GNAT family acetyltransferase